MRFIYMFITQRWQGRRGRSCSETAHTTVSLHSYTPFLSLSLSLSLSVFFHLFIYLFFFHLLCIPHTVQELGTAHRRLEADYFVKRVK